MAVPDIVTHYHTPTLLQSVSTGLLMGHGNMKVSGLFLSIFLLIFTEQVVADDHLETIGDITFECRSGWSARYGNCYLVVDVPMIYEHASLTCMGQGGYLYYAENVVEYMDYVSTLLDKTIWFDYKNEDGKWVVRGDEVPPDFIPGWGNGQPDLKYNYTVVNPRNLLKLTEGDKLYPFVCKHRACKEGYVPCDLATQCILKERVCDTLLDCQDNSDENNCPQFNTWHLRQNSGSINTGTFNDFQQKTWLIESSINRQRIKLNIPRMDLEENVMFLDVLSGGPTPESSELLHRFTGSFNAVSLYSTTNFVIIRMNSKDLTARSGSYTITWTTSIPQIPNEVQVETADASWKSFAIPFSTEMFQPKDLELWWRIEAGMDKHIIYYLQIIPDEGFSVHDVEFKIMADNWEEELRYRDYYVSATNEVYVRSYFVPMHGTVRIRYRVGVDLALDTAYGRILSPHPIPNNFEFSWTLTSGQVASTGMSVKFEEIDLTFDPRSEPVVRSEEKLMVYTNMANEALVGIEEGDIVHSEMGSVRIEIIADAVFMSQGVVVRFGRDCEALDLSPATIKSTNMTYMFEDVILTCPDGHVFNMSKFTGDQSVTATCFVDGYRVNGEHLGVVPECQPVSCGIPTKIENGGLSFVSGVTLGHVAQYSCNEGFLMTDGPVAVCLSDGSWVNVPTCSSSDCPALDPVFYEVTLGVMFEIIRGNNFTDGSASFNTIVQFKCEEGYELFGASISHCKPDGWTHIIANNMPSCERICCEVPPIPHSSVPPEGPSNPTLYLETYSVQCDPNYQFVTGESGSINMFCQADGTFDRTPACEDINECANDASNNCDLDSTVCVNTEGDYRCDCRPGFDRLSSITCTDIRECDMDNGGCSTTCVEEEGSYHCECNEGFNLFKYENFYGFTNPAGETGLRYGDTYYVNHTCVPVPCPTLQPVTNGKYLTDSLNDFYYQDTVTLQCYDGYKVNTTGPIMTSMVSTCGSDGTWDGIYHCEARECILPSTPEHGEFDMQTVYFEDTVTLTCNMTEDRQTTRTAVCLYENNDVRFAGDDMTDCPKIDCGDPGLVLPPGGNYLSGFPPTTTTYFGVDSSFTFTCDSGFDVTGASSDENNNRTVHCKENGRWGLGTLACTGKMCPDPGTPGDARQVVSSYEVGSILFYTCDRGGFTITGPSSYVCDFDPGTNTASWSDDLESNLPSCEDTQAPAFTGQCGETINFHPVEQVSFSFGTVNDNFGTIARLSKSDYMESGDRLTTSASVTYSVADFNNNQQTCTITFYAIDPINDKPQLDCPDDIQIGISTRDSASYDTTSDIIVVGGDLDTSPASIDVTVDKIGTAEIVTAFATNAEYDTQSTCTFMVNFVASACFEEELFDDRYANRVCSGSPLVCTSTCIGNYLYYDRTNSKNFTCSGAGIWDHTATAPIDRYCLRQESPEYEVELTVEHRYGGVSGQCASQYLAKLQESLGLFRNRINDLCDPMEWNVEVIMAEAIPNSFFLFQARFRLILQTDGTTSEDRDVCIDSLNESVFAVAGNSMDCDIFEGRDLNPEIGTLAVQSRNPSCSGAAFDLVVDTCLSVGPGQYYDTNTGFYEDCPTGWYQDDVATTSCKQCPEGEGPTSDKTGCQGSCPDGFTSVTGFYPCTPCEVDSFWNGTACISCPDGGSTVGNEGSLTCYAPCPAGTYSRTGYNVDGCDNCPVNFYQDDSAQLTCKECSPDQITASSGSISSDNCTAIEDVCDTDYCNGHGTCDFAYHRRVCACDSGFYGYTCEFMYHICDGNPCTNMAVCNKGPQPRDFNCTCRKDLDDCKVDLYSMDKIGSNNLAPYRVVSVTREQQCIDACYGDPQCIDASYARSGNFFNCILFDIEIPDNQLTEKSFDSDRHFRKSCYEAFGGELCQLDTENNCAEAGCNSECMDKIDGFQCMCPLAGGLTGTFCDDPNNPCSPNHCVYGTCQPLGSVRYECICQPGYEGVNCSVEIDECSLNPDACAYDGNCNDHVNGYTCSCPTGFSGRYCQDTPNFCTFHDCDGNNICYSSLDRMEGVCVCDEDLFTPLYRCAMNNFQNESSNTQIANLAAATKVVRSFTECEKLCQENSECAVANFVEDNNEFYCFQFNSSYQGQASDVSTAIHKDCNNRPAEAFACEKTREPCDGVNCNHGECQATANGLDYVCVCDTYYTGSHCQHNIDDCIDNECVNNAMCVDLNGTYSCSCADGYEGEFCQDNMNDCPGNCNTSFSTCQDKLNGYECNCNPGYAGEYCDIEINECASCPCKHGGMCTEMVNGFECNCTAGWEGDTCDKRKDNCDGQRTCFNDGECFSLEESSFCRCEGGATGENCENATLLCDTLPDDVCVNDGICVDTAGTAKCSCPVVYDPKRCFMKMGLIGKNGGNRNTYQIPFGLDLTLQECKDSCLANELCAGVSYPLSGSPQICIYYTAAEEKLTVDDSSIHFQRNCPTDYDGETCELAKDWCAMKPCQNYGECMPLGPVGYKCNCKPGYSGPICEVVEDPCDSNPCRGQAMCESTPTDYRCLCEGGKVWTGTFCKSTRTDYTLFVNAARGQEPPHLQSTFRLNTDELSVMFYIRIHYANTDLPEATMFALLGTPDLIWRTRMVYDFTLTVSHFGIYVTFGDESVEGIPFSEDFGYILFDGDWHHVGIAIDKYGMMTATIDALHLPEPVFIGRNLSLDYFGQIYLSYGYATELQLVEVYDKYLQRGNFSAALANLRPSISPVQGFTNYLLPPSARMNSEKLEQNLGGNPNLVMPDMNCSTVEDVYYFAQDRLNSFSSIEELVNIYTAVTEAGGLEYEDTIEETYMWGYYPVIITEEDATTKNYAECRFNLYLRYREVCSIVLDPTTKYSSCPNHFIDSACDIGCDESDRQVIPFPYYQICGSLGVYDPRTPYDTVRSPPCRAYGPAMYMAFAEMQFFLEIPCNTLTEDTLSRFEVKIREIFNKDVRTRWENVCADDDCLNLKNVLYLCDTLHSHRVSVNFTLELSSPTLDAVAGDGVDPVDNVDALWIILVVEKQLDLRTIANAQLLESEVEISQMAVCPPGNMLDESGDEPVCVPCTVGTYLKDGKCMECDYGYYQDKEAQEQCQKCDEGKTTYLIRTGAKTDCKEKCPAGSYYNSVIDDCSLCERHFYQAEEGKNFCLPCNKEDKTVGEGSDSASDCKADCPPGEERREENGPCIMCDRGYWRSLEYDDCQECPVNTTTFKDELATLEADCEMDICALGEYFNNSVGEKRCKPCPLGEYQDEMLMLKCKKCPGNTTTRGEGTVDKSECEFHCLPGYERNGTQEVCLPCERGYYKDNDGDDKFEPCKKCPSRTTDMVAATSQDDCIIPICDMGEIIDDNNECAPCAQDYFSDVEMPSTMTECHPCSVLAECSTCGELYGTKTEGSTSGECLRYCPSGEFLNGENCDLCSRGYYKNNEGNTRFDNCTKCSNRGDSEMTTDIDGAEDELDCNVYKCAAGYIHTEDGCEECDLNFFQPVDHPFSTTKCLPCQPVSTFTTNTRFKGSVDSTDCIPICDPGKYFLNNECESCPRGSFKVNVGESRFGNCTTCSGDFTTEDVGADTEDLCEIPKCNAGTYLVNKVCTPCPPDTYSDVVNPNSEVECIPCEPVNDVIYATETEGSNSSLLCKPTCPGGKQYRSDECVPCPIGFFKGDDIRFGDCISCETVNPGNVTIGTEALTADECDLPDCPPGEKIVGSTCEKCPEGTYQSEPWKSTCIPCGDNRGTDGEGKTSEDECQIRCSAGFHGTTDCTKCPLGTYKPQAGFGNCLDCEEDLTSNEARDDCDVVFCSIGKEYTLSGNQESCTPCGIGFYKNELGNEQECQVCEPGTTTNGTGQASCDLLYCEPGKYEEDSMCKVCEIGTFKSNAGNMACTPCSGKFTTSVTGATSSTMCDVVVCDPGNYRNPEQKTLCTPCGLGTYQPFEGRTSCEVCPNNEITLDDEQTSEDACVPECKKGQQYNASLEECILCPTGTFKDVVGNVEMCQLCQQDKTTAGQGSTSPDDCSQNVCPPGKYYRVESDQVVCFDCGIGYYSDRTMQEDCTKCPGATTTQVTGSDSEDYCIDDCEPGHGYWTYTGQCQVCVRGQYNAKQGKNPNTCKLCSSGKTNSQEGSLSCSFDGDELIDQRINMKFTLTFRVAVDDCSDMNAMDLVINRVLVLLRALLQQVTNQRYNGLWQFCRGTNCNNLGLFTSMPRCRLIPTVKRAITHEIEVDFEINDASKFISDPDDNDVNIDAIEIISQILTNYGQDLSDTLREIVFVGYDNITTTDLCVKGQELVNDICTPCPPGTYGSESGECTLCGINTYQNENGKTECKLCPELTYTENRNGSTSETDCIPICQAGFEFNSDTKTCSECEIGFYKVNAGNGVACSPCLPDRTTPGTGSTSPDDCSQTVCLPGSYVFIEVVTGNIRCDFCPLHTFNPNRMVDSCEECPDGKVTQLIGRKTETDCIERCIPGYGYDTFSGSCVICERGLYNDAQDKDSNGCKYCDDGETTNQPGLASCVPVPTPRVVKQVTIVIRATFEAAITTCGDADLNSIRTTISVTVITVFINSRARFNGERSFCRTDCANLFIVFPVSNICRAKSAGRRKRALTHEIDVLLEFRNVTESTVNTETGEELPTEEVINQILAYNQDELTPQPDQIVYKSSDAPVSEPVCNAGEQPVNNDCAPCAAGSYSTDGETCEVCGKDTYQNEAGQSSCKDCPKNTFYEGTGATSSSACGSWCANNPSYCNNKGVCTDTGRRTASCSCTENYEGPTCNIKKEPTSDLPAILGGAIGGGAALLFIILIAVGVIYRCSRGSSEKKKTPYQDPEFIQNGAYEGTYDNFGYHGGQVRPVAPYPSVGYPAIGYKPDTSFEEGSYARAYKYRPSMDDDDARGQADDDRFVWTA